MALVPVTEQARPQQRELWQPLGKGHCPKCDCMPISFDWMIIAMLLVGQVVTKATSQVLMLILSAPSAAFAVTGYGL